MQGAVGLLSSVIGLRSAIWEPRRALDKSGDVWCTFGGADDKLLAQWMEDLVPSVDR